MIIYFADRHMNVLGQASTGLPSGFSIRKDEKIEETDTGVASFSCYITFEDEDRLTVEDMTDAGNYLLRKNDDENEFYTIIDSEVDPESHEVYIYAEDAGLDLLNEIADPYEATEAHPIAWYIEKWTEDSGFEIGINEVADLSRKLKWDGESTVTERLASVATQFDNAEISYSFDIDGLIITNKYVNIYKKRGKDIGDELRINKHLNNIIVKKSVANLATALRVTGGTPEGQEEPITLKGYSYDDGDFYVDSNGVLKSRKAVERWSRYCWEKKIPGYEGHIEKTYSYDTTSQQTLCAHAVTELKSICEMEVNYEADIAILPDTVKIGDRENIVDDNGELYVSARLLQLKTSIVEGTRKATFGEYLIKDSGISDKVEALAAQFAEIAKARVFYTWIAYADDNVGTGISLDPTGKAYMGISANRTSETPDISNPSVYKWSKVQGDKGDIGLSLVSVTEYYLLSNLTEGVTVDTAGWSTDIPTMSPDNKYLWNYEVFTYSDESTETMDPKIIGAYGETGAAGDPAPAIVTMTEEYYLSTSNSQLTGGEWVRTMPEWETGKYLWTRWCIEWSEPNPTTLTYSDPVVATSFNEIHEAADSAKTAAEEAKTEAESATNQVSQVNTELAQAQQELEELTENLEALESTMSTNYATKGELTQINTDLGTRIDQNAAQISSTATKVQEIDIDASQALQDAADAAAAAAQAQQNATDAQNKYTALKQQADVTDEQLAAAKEAVEEAQKAATEAGDAAAAAQSAADSLSDRVTTAESNITQLADRISQTVSKVEKAVSSVKIEYALSDSATTAPTSGWSTTAPAWVDGKYMWQKTTTTKGDGTSSSTTTCISGAKGATGPQGAKGDKGDTGATGPQGATGKGVKSSAVTYQASTSGTTIPTGTWSSTIPSVAAGSFLWTRTIITYTDNTTTTSYSVGKMGNTGATGAKGDKGDTGAAGKGVKSTAVTYQAGASQTTVPTGTWLTTVPTLTTALPYLWTRTVITYTDNTTSTSYSVSSTLDSFEVGGRNLAARSGFGRYAGSKWYSDMRNTTEDGYVFTVTGNPTDLVGFKVPVEPGVITVSGKTGLEQIKPYYTFYEGETIVQNQRSQTIDTGNGEFAFQLTVPSSASELQIGLGYYPYASATGTYALSHVKIEKGNKSTDWTPAPEDMATSADVDHITEVELVDIRESITNINQTAEDIQLSVSDIETKQTAMDELRSQIEQITSVLIENGKVTFDFDTIKQQVEGAVEELERRNRYVAITEDATLGATITIGDSESGMVGRFTKTSLDFLSGDTVIASYANDGLTTENITTNNQLKFGSNWAIRPGAGGNLNDVWIGG